MVSAPHGKELAKAQRESALAEETEAQQVLQARMSSLAAIAGAARPGPPATRGLPENMSAAADTPTEAIATEVAGDGAVPNTSEVGGADATDPCAIGAWFRV